MSCVGMCQSKRSRSQIRWPVYDRIFLCEPKYQTGNAFWLNFYSCHYWNQYQGISVQVSVEAIWTVFVHIERIDFDRIGSDFPRYCAVCKVFNFIQYDMNDSPGQDVKQYLYLQSV